MKRSYQQHTPYAQICDNMGYGSCPSRTALFVYGQFRYEDMNEERDKIKYQPLATDELQGKGGQCFLSDGKVEPWEVSEKIILARLRYFSRKPCRWRRFTSKPTKSGTTVPTKNKGYEDK